MLFFAFFFSNDNYKFGMDLINRAKIENPSRIHFKWAIWVSYVRKGSILIPRNGRENKKQKTKKTVEAEGNKISLEKKAMSRDEISSSS